MYISVKNLYSKIFIATLFIAIFTIYIFSSSSMYCFFINKKNINIAVAYQATTIQYGKALQNCVMFKTTPISDNINDILFFVPETYFVRIINKISDELLYVQYENFTGYCSADNVEIANFTPTNPVLTDITFDISDKAGTQIWSNPTDQTGRILTTISANTKNITYIASTLGDIPMGGKTNIWYYARYTPASNSTLVYEGYIYNESVVNLSNIPNNLEFNLVDNNSLKNTGISLNNPIKIILIVLISLPFIILFALAVYKANKQFKKQKSNILEEQEVVPVKNNKSSIQMLSSKQFVQKQTKVSPRILHPEDEVLEVVFPEYNFIDDDDLL